MATLTTEAKNAAKEINVKPNVVLKIDGYSKRFSNVAIQRYIRIGDPGLVIGPDWKIGGYTLLEDQHNWLLFNQGSTTKISQTVQPDRGQASGVARMVVVLMDKDEEISKLISPGQELADILARGCEIELGFESVVYPDSYVTIIRGIFETVESGAGYVIFAINQVEDQKNRPFAQEKTAKLGANITDISSADIPVDDTSIFPVPTADTTLSFAARIGDELILYTGKTATHLTGITRAYFGTTASAHSLDDDVTPYYRIQGLAIEIALKMMLSGWQGPYATGVAIKNFRQIDPATNFENAIFFDGVDLLRDWGVCPGTLMTVTGATNGANNFSSLAVSEVVKTLEGSYLTIEGQTFVTELGTGAVAAFRSEYDTWGAFGLALSQRDVDIETHKLYLERYLGGYDLDFMEKAIPNVKTFLDQQIYLPAPAFSIPKFGKASMAFFAPPLPTDDVPILDKPNVQDPDKIKIARSLSNNFANAVEFRFDHDPIKGEFKSFYTQESAQSLAQIKTKPKPMVIESRGMRESLAGSTIAAAASNRILSRYQFGAEYLKGVSLLYGVGYPLEMGQVVEWDTNGLNVTNFGTGNRDGKKVLVEVLNKSLDIANAEITVDLINTVFGIGTRFATWGPSSQTKAGSTSSILKLKRSFGTKTYQTEGRKWVDFVGLKILVHNEDFTTSGEATIASVYNAENSSITLTAPLGFTPGEDYIIDLANFPNNTDPLDQERAKQRHIFWSPNPLVATGISQTQFTVAAPDVANFKVGFPLIVHNEDYSISNSTEVKILDITGTTITTDAALGFTPSTGMICDLLGFPDSSECYRFT